MKKSHIMKIKPIKAFFLHYKEHSSTFFFLLRSSGHFEHSGFP